MKNFLPKMKLVVTLIDLGYDHPYLLSDFDHMIAAIEFEKIQNPTLSLEIMNLIIKPMTITAKSSHSQIQALKQIFQAPNLDFINKNYIPILFQALATAECRDPQIWENLIEFLKKVDVRDLSYVQKKSLHISLMLVRNLQLLEEDSILQIKNHYNWLSNYCIVETRGMDLVHFVNTKELKMFDCNHSKIIEKVVEVNQDRKKLNRQKYHQNYREKLIKYSLKNFIEKNYEELLEVDDREVEICQYSLDSCIIMKRNGRKLGIEITGSTYTLISGALIGKKQMKFKLIEKLGWDFVSVYTNKDIGYQNYVREDIDEIGKNMFEAICSRFKDKYGEDFLDAAAV